ncbi:hypothetical protein [Actinokineospora bangkokensis]|uniref:Uncharacterized protein n=1 Tax=Actinokineospora bangkokensis TaxID=1193682 RepID=A0A1Q9LGX4_9PSEU|nr:hypothetical protein [Actinokineospora bangkokensis]OLR91273.1 hypothetical protein BJP25_26765 [Actinokineospora bangkokensis]
MADRYRDALRDTAPGVLRGREDELGDLAAFAAGAPAHRHLRAPAGAGGTALLSWFALHPPEGTRVVAFLVTRGLAEQDHRAAFVEEVLEQLADLLDQPLPPLPTTALREAHLRGLLAEAGDGLVLVVDGLDEDSGQGGSIAALLPAGGHVLTCATPGWQVPVDVPPDHPLRSAEVVDLAPSPAATLDGLPDSAHDVLGLLATARGLTADDVADLLEVDGAAALPGVVQRRSGWHPGRRVLLLAHAELQREAERTLPPARHREALHAWAEQYRALGWPPTTPEYLLGGYFRVLLAERDVPRLLELATDHRRHDATLAVTGSDSRALQEIAELAALIPDDTAALARLAIHQDRLLGRAPRVPTTLPAVWAGWGHLTRAASLLHGVVGEVRTALAEVVRRAEPFDPDRLGELVASFPRDDSAPARAVLAGRAGDRDRLTALRKEATEVDVAVELVRAWVALGDAADDTDDAVRVAEDVIGPPRTAADAPRLDLIRAVGPGPVAQRLAAAVVGPVPRVAAFDLAGADPEQVRAEAARLAPTDRVRWALATATAPGELAAIRIPRTHPLGAASLAVAAARRARELGAAEVADRLGATAVRGLATTAESRARDDVLLALSEAGTRPVDALAAARRVVDRRTRAAAIAGVAARSTPAAGRDIALLAESEAREPVTDQEREACLWLVIGALAEVGDHDLLAAAVRRSADPAVRADHARLDPGEFALRTEGPAPEPPLGHVVDHDRVAAFARRWTHTDPAAVRAAASEFLRVWWP